MIKLQQKEIDGIKYWEYELKQIVYTIEPLLFGKFRLIKSGLERITAKEIGRYDSFEEALKELFKISSSFGILGKPYNVTWIEETGTISDDYSEKLNKLK